MARIALAGGALSHALVVRWMTAEGQPNGTDPRRLPDGPKPREESHTAFDRWLLRAGQMVALGMAIPELALWGARPQAIGFLTMLWAGLEYVAQKRRGAA